MRRLVHRSPRLIFLRRLALCAVGFALASSTGTAEADLFKLKSGGQVAGKLVDRGKKGEYVVESNEGAMITLTKAQVRKVVAQDNEQLEYNRRSRSMPNTVEAHRALVAWCKQNHLSKLADHHRRRIIALDPDDQAARLSLGYQRHQGQWMTRDQIMAARGLRPYRGDYRTPQDIALREREKKQETAEAKWIVKLRTWRGWLDGRRSAEAAQAISEIRDPDATVAIVKRLDREENQRVRDLLVRTLAQLNHPLAVQTLVQLSLGDPIREVRLQCLDYLTNSGRQVSVAPYVNALRSRDNEIVNRAGEALRIVGNPEAISPLIEALVTTHRYTNADAPPGEINASFSPSGGGGVGAGGGGLSMGGQPKILKRQRQNYEVSRALVELSGGQNFLFDQRAWRRWFVNRQIREFDARRDQ